MLRIGEFSRLARVSVKALRHYDRLGLLEPARTDDLSGYRYYSSEQLPRLNAILALKELGFSLRQISRLLDGSSLEQVRTMLELRRDEAIRTLEVERERLARIEARLVQIEKEGEVPGYEVVLKAVVAQRVASVREVLPAYSAVGSLFDELRAYKERHGVSAGDWIAVWHDAEYKEENVDGEAAFATNDPLPDDEHVHPGELPAVENMACTVHLGSFATIGRAYGALLRWIETNGYRVAGPNRELYLSGGNGQDDADYVTEVQFPVEKVGREEKK
jgi:DNA-binding transcriptional MerR regulator